jgi:cutinase
MIFSSHRGRRLLRALAVSTVLIGGIGGATAVLAPTAAGATCSDIDVVVARGTFEPGTLGIIVGDPMFSALQTAIPGKTLSSYPVNYPADLGEPTSVQTGNRDLVNHVTTQAAACPNQRFILVGYSQGANVVDNSIGISSDGALVGGAIVATIPTSLTPRIAAVLQFGNPIRAQGKSITGTYQARTDDFCADQDPVCQNGGSNVLAHLSYGGNTAAAATFAAARA